MPKRRGPHGNGPPFRRGGGPARKDKLPLARGLTFGSTTSAAQVIALTELQFGTAGTFDAPARALRPLSEATFTTAGAFAAALLLAKRVLAEIQLGTSGSFSAPIIARRVLSSLEATSGAFNAPLVAHRPLSECQFTTSGTLAIALVALRPLPIDLHTESDFAAPVAGATTPLPAIALETRSSFDVVVTKSEIPFAGGGGSGGGALGQHPIPLEQLLEAMRSRIRVTAGAPNESVDPDLQNESEAPSAIVDSAPLEVSAVDQLSVASLPAISAAEAAAVPAVLPSGEPTAPEVPIAALPSTTPAALTRPERGAADTSIGGALPPAADEISIEGPNAPLEVPTPEARQPNAPAQARSEAVAPSNDRQITAMAVEQLLDELNDDAELLAVVAAVYAYASW